MNLTLPDNTIYSKMCQVPLCGKKVTKLGIFDGGKYEDVYCSIDSLTKLGMTTKKERKRPKKEKREKPLPKPPLPGSSDGRYDDFPGDWGNSKEGRISDDGVESLL